MSTTFITAYLKVYDEEYDDTRRFENRLNYFILILNLGINICIFIEPELQYQFNQLEKKYTNLKIITCIKIEELELYKIGNNYPELCNLPLNRNKLKDTKEYIFLMFDLANYDSFDFVKNFINLCVNNKNTQKIILIGNKLDLIKFVLEKDYDTHPIYSQISKYLTFENIKFRKSQKICCSMFAKIKF